MPHVPELSQFGSFYDYDPSRRRKCIYPTAKGPICSFDCQAPDNIRAIELRKEILNRADEGVDINSLIEYIQVACCMGGNAKHKHRIENVGLLEPLAAQWKAEIEKKVARSRRNSPPQPFTPRKPRAALSPISSPKYEAPVSSFQLHIEQPSADDAVAFKILEPLSRADKEREFRTGSLYIFERRSSPGFVKIGWTSRDLETRLAELAECGYTPYLLFRVDNVPYAQRAETLTHHELIKEWHKERLCIGCKTSHQEWFKVSIERAIRVVNEWATVLKTLRLYNEYGYLEAKWNDAVQAIVKKDGVVTASTLLAFANRTPRVETRAWSSASVKVEAAPMSSRAAPVHVEPPRIKQEPMYRREIPLRPATLPARVPRYDPSNTTASKPTPKPVIGYDDINRELERLGLGRLQSPERPGWLRSRQPASTSVYSTQTEPSFTRAQPDRQELRPRETTTARQYPPARPTPPAPSTTSNVTVPSERVYRSYPAQPTVRNDTYAYTTRSATKAAQPPIRPEDILANLLPVSAVEPMPLAATSRDIREVGAPTKGRAGRAVNVPA